MSDKRRSACVAVIGAGPAGLAAARELLREGHSVTVFEAGSDVGGAWHFDSSTDSDLLGAGALRVRVHSSMYEGLRTNLPRHIMSFLDLPFVPAAMAGRSQDPRLYPGHAEVLAYLQAYADAFDLRRHIRFNTSVQRVDPAPCKPAAASRSSSTPEDAGSPKADETAQIKWRVQFATQPQPTNGAGAACGGGSNNPAAGGGAVGEQVFDAVASCCGNFSEPNLPQVEGMAGWPGLQLHSHNYRGPHQFKGMNKVLVVGASFSGEEIARHIAGAAGHVYHSARTFTGPGTAREEPADDIASHQQCQQEPQHQPAPLTPPAATSSSDSSSIGSSSSTPAGSSSSAHQEAIPAAPEPRPNMTRVPMLQQLLPDGSAVFAGGLVVSGLQAVVYCTGYRYSFPWLDHLGLVATSGGHVRPLFLHMFPPSAAPDLSFVGLPWRCTKLPQFQLQGQLLAQLLSGRAQLPPLEEMLQEQQQLFRAMAAAGIPRRYTHCLAAFMPMNEWQYADDLIRLADGRQHSGSKSSNCSQDLQQPELQLPMSQQLQLQLQQQQPEVEQQQPCASCVASPELLVMPLWLRRLAQAVVGGILGQPDTFRDSWSDEVELQRQQADKAAAQIVAARF